jgi:hypothetical protein
MTLGQCARAYAHEDDGSTRQHPMLHIHPQETVSLRQPLSVCYQAMSDSTVAQTFITSTVPASHKKTGG